MERNKETKGKAIFNETFRLKNRKSIVLIVHFDVSPLQVNGTDLSEASHFKAVEVIKSASEPLQIVVKRKLVDESLDDCVPQLVSTGTQTDLSFAQEVESMDTDSGIHDRYSPRQDLLNPFEKSLDDGTSSSECSRRRLESFCREDVENLRSTSESLPSSENIVYSEQGTLPRVTRLLKDVNYVNHLDENSNCKLEEQPYVTAISDEIYFDPEFDYEYEVIMGLCSTLWDSKTESRIRSKIAIVKEESNLADVKNFLPRGNPWKNG